MLLNNSKDFKDSKDFKKFNIKPFKLNFSKSSKYMDSVKSDKMNISKNILYKIKQVYEYNIDNHFHELSGFFLNNDKYIIKKFSLGIKNNSTKKFSLKIIFDNKYKLNKKIKKNIKKTVKLYIFKNYVHINFYNNNFYNLIDTNNNLILNNNNIYDFQYTILLSKSNNILIGGVCDRFDNTRKTINFTASPIYSEPSQQYYSNIIKILLNPNIDPRTIELDNYTPDEILAVRHPTLDLFKQYIRNILISSARYNTIFGPSDVHVTYVFDNFDNHINWSNYLVSVHLSEHKYAHNGIDDFDLIDSLIPTGLTDDNRYRYIVFYHSFLHLLDGNYMYNNNNPNYTQMVNGIQSYRNSFINKSFSNCVFYNLQLNKDHFLFKHNNQFCLPYYIKNEAQDGKIRQYIKQFIDDNDILVPEYKMQFHYILQPAIYPSVSQPNCQSKTTIFINDPIPSIIQPVIPIISL